MPKIVRVKRSDVDEEYEVSKNEEGFYELTECDVKDCNAVGKEEKKYPK
jgi:hypothetical protein